MKTTKKFILSILAIFVLSLTSCSEQTTSDNEIKGKETGTNISARYSEQEMIDRVQAIARELDADIVYDSSIKADNAIVFETEAEAREFISKMKLEAQDTEILGEEELAKMYYATAMTSGFATLGFDISTGSNGCITSVHGGWSGWTLGVGYTQGGTSLNCHSATVCGTVNYNIVFEGIGTFHSQHVCYTITIP
ncbi:hypothetical protein [Flavobacterium sp.]|jgi:hypothetical protein|uniref:hypothetical protein n=1 Tax=Flavobacterium sp. TaxID=239 RepID=UPI0037BE368C